MDEWEPDDAESRVLDHLATVFAIAVITSWICAALAASRAPWVPDLYNVVFHGTRPQKGEGTAFFLFCFPAMLTAGVLSIFAHARGWFPTSPSFVPFEIKGAFILLWSAVFFFGSINRSWLVYTNAY